MRSSLVWVYLHSRNEKPRDTVDRRGVTPTPTPTPGRAVLVELGRGSQVSVLCCSGWSDFLWGPKAAVLASHGISRRERGLTPGIPSQPLRSRTLSRPDAYSSES